VNPVLPLARWTGGPAVPEAQRLNRVLLGCGAAAGPLFIAVFTAAGAARPFYSAVRHPVSSLALGPGGWIQKLNFGANGVLYLALAAGLARSQLAPRGGPLLIGAAGVGQVVAGAFDTDPVSGYPPGTPASSKGYSGTGALLHDLGAVPIFLGIPVAALIWARTCAGRGDHRWARYSTTTAGSMVCGFILTSAAFAQAPGLAPVGGLLQRMTISAGMGWLTALSVHALKTGTSDPSGPAAVRRPPWRSSTE
jgi:hypothetical protein